MKLTLGFSPCPNDTYIFDALVHQKVDTEGLEFDYFLEDVEKLNSRAFAEEPDVTKLSFHVFLHLAGKYLLLDAGSALGFGAGPLLISKNFREIDELADKNIAVPGKYTTANLLLSLAMPHKVNKIEYLFSDIEDAILSGEVDAGVIIHENRFTYQQRGLLKIMDLGEYWETITGSPVPLGGIAVHKRLGEDVAAKVDRSIRRSLEYANAQKDVLPDFVRCHAQEMNEEVMRQHIGLYVNKYSISLGQEGRAAVNMLFDKALKLGIIPNVPDCIFAQPLQARMNYK